MATKKRKHFAFGIALLTAIAILFLQITAFAQGNELSLTIQSNCDGKPIASEKFELYEFAYYNDDGDLIIIDDFKNYDVDYENMTQENWESLADIVTGYALRDGIEPSCVGETDENGILVLDGDDNLNEAVYLIVGETLNDGDTIYTCNPFFVTLPGSDNGKHIYQSVVEPKIVQEDLPISGEVKVLKVWDDDDNSANRPKNIEVQLLKDDGEVYSTKKLNKDNNWRYTWKNLDPTVNWRVVEKSVPAGYTVSLEVSNNTFTLTNKFTSTSTTKPKTETTTNQNKPSETTTSLSKKTNTSTTDNKLPQTGLSWLPVPILLIIGLSLIIFGVIRNRNGDKNYEN